MNPIIIASIIGLGGLGLFFGATLAYASKKFAVEVDPRVEEIDEILPQANCGGCGYPSCSAYAEAVVKGDAPPNLCVVGGQPVAERVASILGVQAEKVEEKIAVVKCGGGYDEAKRKYIYEGIKDCNVAAQLGGGDKACEYGCLGLGSCVEACPYDAMAMNDNGLPVVFDEKCTGCGLCVEACPKGIMQLIPKSQKVYVACVSHDRGKAVTSVCSVGCTGCGLCANPKFTPSGLVKMDREINLPVIPVNWPDYETAVAKCPTKSFVLREVEVKKEK